MATWRDRPAGQGLNNHKLTSYTATYRFMRAFTRDPNPAVMAEFERAANGVGHPRDAHLADGRSSWAMR